MCQCQNVPLSMHVGAVWWKRKGFHFYLPPQSSDITIVGGKHQVYQWFVLMDQRRALLLLHCFSFAAFKPCTYLIITRFSSGVVFLGEVPQVVVIVEVEVRHQLLVNRRLSHEDTICDACRLGKIKRRPISINCGGLITWEKRMPRTLFPSRSKGGDQHIIPIMLGTTRRIAPEMPDLAGKPTWAGGAKKTSKTQLEALEAKILLKRSLNS